MPMVQYTAVHWGAQVAPEGGALECSSLVQGESLAMLSGEVGTLRQTVSKSCVTDCVVSQTSLGMF